MTDGDLTRDDLVELLVEPGRRLHDRDVHADLYVVGGAAMALQLDARTVTRDVDAVFSPPTDVLEAAAALAAERHLPAGWLSSSAAACGGAG